MNGSAHRKNNSKRDALRRLAALALALVLTSGFLPFFPTAPTASAADWMQPYLDQMVEWGIMRGDASGNLNADRQITRAEFVTLVNRAFGYTEMGDENPFSDVPDDAWYSEDIRIAHHMGYFNGTSESTASPTALMTREQAAALIGRNLRLKSEPGLNTTFADNTDIGVWSRGMVQEAADMGIIQGYADGTFRPKNYVTRGQVAVFLSRALGTLIKEPGDQTLGGIYGNVTITSPGVTLRDTTITGNLYLTGGIGLGNVELQNVTVLGKIVVCGAGESHEGDNSIVLRNVTADTLEVDSLTDQFVTIRSEGLTEIENTTVRTSGYLEDLTEDGLGLKYIELNGNDGLETPPTFQLAGNIKEVKNFTPEANVVVAQGLTHKLTMDEEGVGAKLTVDNNAGIRELNLDTGTNVSGTGSIDILNVNTDGSVVSMLPDNITVRPGVTANINREEMNTTLAAESSDEPRLLTGYPTVKNIASTSADAVFSTNKKGTIYWALTALTDGSVGEEELLNPSAYPAKIIKSGTLNAAASKTELLTKLTGLTRSGSYYLSAMLVDNRNHYSPVKVAAFTTTDDSTPAFSTGYPTVILAENRDGEQVVQSMVMANKNCKLYYVLMPKGSSTPTPDAFKSGAISGNLGFGIVDLYKDTPHLLSQINTSYLSEQTTYELYLWLNDADNGKSSAVKKLTVTTLDKTPPVVAPIFQSDSAANRATITFAINEPATLYWAVVPAGDTFLRPAVAGDEIRPEDLAAKIQVESGTYSTRHGSASASRADTNYTFTINSLTPQMSYDLYYVAKDRAGNYSEKVLVYTPVKTLDELDPTVTQEFSLMQGDRPLTETDVTLVFSELVWGTYKEKGEDKYDDFEALYQEVEAHEDDDNPNELNRAKDALASALEKYIFFHKYSASGQPLDAVIKAPGQTDGDWDIDFREAVVTKADGKTRILFPSGTGINLQSGGTYYFTLQSICDTSGNVMDVTTLPEFTTIFATVNLAIGDTMQIYANELEDEYFGDNVQTEGTGSTEHVRVDMSFTMLPVSTERVPAGTGWDMLLWTNQTISFTLYSRTRDSANRWGEWKFENSIPTIDVQAASGEGGRLFVSLDKYIRGQNTYPELRDMTREMEFAIHVDTIEQNPDYTAWNKNVTFQVTVLAGGNYALNQTALTTAGYKSDLDRGIQNGSVSIGVKDPFEVIVPFTDSKAPNLVSPYPAINAGDIGATVEVMLDRPGTVYYVVAPLEDTSEDDDHFDAEGIRIPWITETNYRCPVTPRLLSDTSTMPDIEDVYGIGQDGKAIAPSIDGDGNIIPLELSRPFNTEITAGIRGTTGVFSGSLSGLSDNVAKTIPLNGLTPNKTYFLYIVTQGVSPVYSNTMVFQFSTSEAIKPILDIERVDSENAVISVDKSSVVDYILVTSDSLTGTSTFNQPFTYNAANPGASNAAKEWADVQANYGDVKTILDAMLTSYYRSGVYMGSIFDNFASDSARNTVAERIRSTATQGSSAPADKATLSLTLPPDAADGTRVSSDMINFTNKMLDDGTYYTLLAVARTTNSSKDSFRAAAPFYRPNNDMLAVTVCSLSDDYSTAYGVTGRLTVVFNDDLYYRQTTSQGSTGQNRIPLDTCGKSVNGHTGLSLDVSYNGTTYGNIGRFLTMSDTITLNEMVSTNAGTHTAAGDTLVFNLNNVKDNQDIILSASVCGETKRNHSMPLTIKFVRNAVLDPDTGTTIYEYEPQITVAEWDARGG